MNWRIVNKKYGDYKVSDTGVVVNIKTERTLKPRLLHGYTKFWLCKNGERKTIFAHRLVWESFNGQVPKGMEINHIDFNKANPSLENLEICTPKENYYRSVSAGRAYPWRRVTLLSPDGAVHEFESTHKACKELGLNKGHLYYMLKFGRTINGWSVVGGGSK